MFPCPRCQHELPANARFCNYCGFNQTNARIESIRAAQEALNAPPVPPAVPSTPPPSGNYKPVGSMRSIKVEPKQNSLIVSGKEQVQMTSTPPPPKHLVQAVQPQSAPYVPETPPLSKGNSLTGRYVAGQETRQAPTPPAPTRRIVPQTPQQMPLRSAQRPQASVMPETSRPGSSTMRQIPQSPVPASSRQSYEWGLGMPDTVSLSDSSPYTPYSDIDNKSLSATNKAAEQWHKSWRDRQHDEAGPAVNVSRGQASVPEPLLAMQHSIVRMRAIVMPKNKDKQSNLGFWMIVIMMFCLFAGLISYIVSTYLPGTKLASQSITTSISHTDPTLAFQQQSSTQTSLTAGQTIHVQGASFGPNDQIIFLLDTTTLNGTATTDSHGSFNATLTIPSTELAGAYALQAQDNHTGQHAFLNFTVTSSTTNTTSLSLSVQGNLVSSLAFTSIVGQNNPPQKNVAITNNGSTTLQWSVSAITNDTTDWLTIADKQTGGQLDPQQSTNINVGVITQGLGVNDKNHPYKGDIIFTVANQGQVILPVQLQVVETGIEVIISPNPVTAAPSTTTPGGCQDASLTLVNLNNTFINWTVKPSDDYNAQHIHVDGQTTESGTLTASGSNDDTKVVQLTCIGVQLGKSYTLTVYYNGQAESVPVNISNQ